jgi:protocatechuate 3,4-dioxygenase beta subunit
VKPTRRTFLRLLVLLAPAPFMLAPGRRALAATPPCDDGDDVTPRQTTGPFYTPDSPRRASLREPGIAGTPIVVSGSVLTTDCRPVAGALVDFWHADDRGVYDNAGYKLRGHQFTDAQGRYTLKSIVPGLYGGRTRHFHVKVQASHRRVLTTQLYFPGEPRNARDGLFDPRLLMAVEEAGGGKTAAFDFVLPA